MNLSLLEKIEAANDAVLVTVLSTEGHSYKKRGDKALYLDGSPLPAYGNLGTTCVDPYIVEAGAVARRQGTPKRITVDTTDPSDIHLGTGTYCGGRVELLVEPIFAAQKEAYRRVRAMLENNEQVHLVHDMTTGDVTFGGTASESGPDTFAETIQPGPRLCIFGGTPLTRHIVRLLEDTDFSIHVSDWREGYLSMLKDVPRVTLHLDQWPVDADTFALLLSHNHERDLSALREALACHCRFIGLLSSTGRRDNLFAQLADENFSKETLQTISSPVGIDIHGRSDAEIAVSIAAELIEVKNR